MQPEPRSQPQLPQDDPPADLIRQRQELRNTYDAVNRANPFSPDYGKAAPADATAPTGAAAKALRVLEKPFVQAYLKPLAQPVVRESITRVARHPNAKVLLGAEIGLLVLMVLLRAWRVSRVQHWARKLWTGFTTLVFGSILGILVVPALIIGDSYVGVLKDLWDAVIR